MMNMSSEKNPAESSAPFVEAFHYPQVSVSANGETRTAVGQSGVGADREGEQLALRLKQAREEGIREGEQREKSRVEQEIAQQRAKITEAVATFERERSDYYSKIEAEVVHLAVAIAAKILHREAQLDRMLLAALVKIALEKLQQNTRVLVRVPRQQAAAWRQYFAQNAPMPVSPEVVEDDSIGGSDCVLETALGSTELGLEAQLKEVETGLFDLLAQKPDTLSRPSKSGIVVSPGAR